MTKGDKTRCDFCQKTVLKNQLVYRDKIASIIYPQNPVILSHLMIIPNRHVERFGDLTNKEIIEMGQLVKRTFLIFQRQQNTCGFNLIINDGTKAGQKIPHVHWHLFFRFKNERASPFRVLNNPELREKISAEEWKRRKNKVKKLFTTRL